MALRGTLTHWNNERLTYGGIWSIMFLEPENSSQAVAIARQTLAFKLTIDMGWRSYPARDAARLVTCSQLQPTKLPENGAVGNLFTRSVPMAKHVRAITASGRVESVVPIDKIANQRVMRLAAWFCENVECGDDDIPPTRKVDDEEYVCCDYCLKLAGRTVEFLIVADDEHTTKRLARRTRRPKRKGQAA